MRFLGNLFGFLFATGFFLFLVGAAGLAALIYSYSQDLPDYTQLKNYEPPVMTRLHAGDGSLMAEYARERRLYLPSSAIPLLVKQAFISAEDKNFYKHNGIDLEGILRAGLVFLQGSRHVQGASTITQQVAKNFLLGNERSFDRKIREALISLRIESAYSKERILELYLNEIYLGLGNYGVAAAALNYFGKSASELTLPEAAYLAALPKGPNNYHPFRFPEAAIARRNYVIDRMVENGYVTKVAGEEAKRAPLGVNPRSVSPNSFAAGFFVEEVRRELSERYGEKALYEGGLSVRTTLDPKLQLYARKALVDGLVRYDEAHGWRGALKTLDVSADWGPALAELPVLHDIAPWQLAVVLDVSDAAIRIGLQPGHDKSGGVSTERVTGVIVPDGAKWTRKPLRQLVKSGDVIYAEPLDAKSGQYRLRQLPEISGAIVAMDPHTGRVLAMIGGVSYDQSEFNRATQALRQPGSAFKPFVYAAAIDQGYTPSSLELDTPLEIDQGPGLGLWRPENYDGKFGGAHTLRYGVEHSKNLMTAHLAQDIGLPVIVDYAKRFGIYDNLPLYNSISLGSGETTVLRLTTAYSMLVNGGRRIKASLIDRIQDRYGRTIYRHDERKCEGCEADKWANQNEPRLIDKNEQVLDPLSAYQIVSILEGVVLYGTGQSIRAVGKHLAGKTGTTNDAKDVWFEGFSPDLCVGVFMGYDHPRSLGASVTAAQIAAPVFRDFMALALKDKPDAPFRVPPGIKLVSVDAKTGVRATGPGTIMEAFKPGTAPPSGYANVPDQPAAVVGIDDQAVKNAISGNGGLY